MRFLTEFKILSCCPNFIEFMIKCKINTKQYFSQFALKNEQLIDLQITNRHL